MRRRVWCVESESCEEKMTDQEEQPKQYKEGRGERKSETSVKTVYLPCVRKERKN
jgi:hypothetical protein